MYQKHFIKKIYSLPLPLTEKIFMSLRYVSAPFLEIEKMIPKNARILDVGCGHGLFELVLQSKAKKRTILAIDPDKNKIIFAKKIEKLLPQTKFRNYSIFQIKNKQNKIDCVVIFDVDYLLQYKDKLKMLKKAKELLDSDGVLILKTVIRNNSFGYYLGYFQELLTVSIFKKTLTKGKTFEFMSTGEYKSLLIESGFAIKKEGKLKTIFYHPHYFFVAKK